MTSRTELWDRLGKTDPSHTKAFQRAGGFKGTAIKPMWSYRRMTEEYGPCGFGWGIGEPTFQVVHAGEEILVYCTASVWHGARDQIVFGVGGDKVVGKFSSGIKSDDEAFKKAFTDAVTNALKMIGVGADVHMGLFDDSKYVAGMKSEFADKRENPHVTRPEDIFPAVEYDENGQPIDSVVWGDSEIKPLPKKDAKEIYRALQAELWAHQTLPSLDKWAATIPDRVAALPIDWAETFRGQFKEYKLRLKTKEAA